MHRLQIWSVLAWATALALGPLASAKALPKLRILPLGDSITQGSLSSSGDGYRGPLRDGLTSDGDASVDMIGTLTRGGGTMADNDHEGHSGEYIENIRNWWQKPMAVLPNVVLLHAGTNNMDKNQLVNDCPAMMKTMIEGMFKVHKDVTILVAPVIYAKSAAMNARSATFNTALGQIIDDMRADGKHIVSVPMGIDDSDLSPAPDYKHPNDKGYRKMASKWKQAIIDANEDGWLKDAPDVSDPGGVGLGDGGGGGSDGSYAGCKGGNWEKKGTVFDQFKIWEEKGVFMPAQKNGRRDKVLLADLNGDGIADYILADDDGTVRVWTSNGAPNDWSPQGAVNPDWSTIKGEMIRVADVDGDGHADLIALYSDGAAKVWRNTNYGKKFENLDSKWATGLGPRDKIQFEDVDGDGRADYVVVYDNGSVKWARNTGNNGKDDSKKNWEALEEIAPGPAGVPANRASLRDLDGDGKADYVVTYDGGAVKAFINTGSLNSAGRNWDDQGTIAPGISGVTGNMIRFANVDDDKLADFLVVADDGSIKWWKNLGIVGNKGASIRFATLTESGLDDVISIDAKGRARAWINKENGQWDSIGEISPGFPDDDMSASEFLFADLNGDGLDDYVIVYGGGAVKVFLNNGVFPNTRGNGRLWGWPLTISDGVGEPGRKVQFADLNGDGYADYLLVYDGGAVEAFLNNKDLNPEVGGRIWSPKISVAPGVGQPGSKVRFVDITGDGKDDYIVQYDGGAAKGYANTGNIPKKGTARSWAPMGTIAAGVTPQGPVSYAKYSNATKDDYLVVYDDGTINAWVNICDWKITIPPPTDDNPGDGDDDEDEDEHEPYEPDPDDDEPLEACPYSPTTLDEIWNLDFSNDIPSHCVPKYMIPVLHNLLEETIERYNEIIDDGYDHYFDVYADFLVKNSALALYEFMMDKGDEYFNCDIWQEYPCCTTCEFLDVSCDECIVECHTQSPQDGGTEFRLRSQPCPPDYSKRGIGDDRWQSIDWSFKNDDAEDKFYVEASAEIGAPEDKFIIRDHDLIYKNDWHADCMGYGNDYEYEEMDEICISTNWWTNAPHVKDFEVDDVVNPKKIAMKSLEDADLLREPLGEFGLAILAGQYEGDEYDLVDALILPVFMLKEAVDYMETVAETGEEIEEAERIAFIINLISGLLILVTISGTALVSSGLTTLGRTLVYLAEVGNTAIGLHAAVTTPESAPLLIFGLVMSGVGIRDINKVSKAAKIKRSMTYKEIASFSKEAAKMASIGRLNVKPGAARYC